MNIIKKIYCRAFRTVFKLAIPILPYSSPLILEKTADVAVLEPALTKDLPYSLTATTGMDALTHAVEAYIGRSTVKSTRKDAEEAVCMIIENIEKAYSEGDMKAREKMLKASFLAGRAFTKSYVGYCHAVAPSLGGKYNTPHGLANAVLLPYTLELY